MVLTAKAHLGGYINPRTSCCGRRLGHGPDPTSSPNLPPARRICVSERCRVDRARGVRSDHRSAGTRLPRVSRRWGSRLGLIRRFSKRARALLVNSSACRLLRCADERCSEETRGQAGGLRRAAAASGLSRFWPVCSSVWAEHAVRVQAKHRVARKGSCETGLSYSKEWWVCEVHHSCPARPDVPVPPSSVGFGISRVLGRPATARPAAGGTASTACHTQSRREERGNHPGGYG
jgi:hypothetical protein